MMTKGTGPRLIHCVRKEYITPNLLRITFSGDELDGFPDDQNGAMIKLFFPNAKTGLLELPYMQDGVMNWPVNKPVSRAYTVRYYRPEQNELDVDFVTHSANSPASGWAISANTGDTIAVAGPGGQYPLINNSDWHIVLADLTGAAAFSALLENLDSAAKGIAVLEVYNAEDIHEIQCPQGIKLVWLLKNSDKRSLFDVLVECQIPEDVNQISAFVAAENECVIQCRNYLRNTLSVERKNINAMPYWRKGKDEDTYHDERHEVMNAAY
ncbi:siderophore-interacting protein [Vibrio sp. SCSIO 43136]|uniref:siderophore-interacting protein n=1 Tax=Vibrio sp. SCSIO 43136 TaxID=2819101 RepID=UPI002075BE18|nr:siderophore-interacting protein [Vibrio sp. SCSIO 43136]USD64507.1 siderophore-interacting protein [Vibrio sp. SCSIO 43136]